MKKENKEIFKSKNKSEIINKIKDWSKKKRAVEICGFLGFKNEEYILWLCSNIADDPKRYFAIDPIDFLYFQQENQMACVFHSHIYGDENPSEFDVTMSENCCIPFMIYSLNTKKFKIHEPKTNHANLDVLKRIKENL
ncbi:MAG: Mov34/MPN/PAD-1 family protein [Candidatus Lokiarchaeota archaeon]|nr:Mov34/MPN/PAD-1 family protein [Candidatus Lokiarchaeota archaeon]